MNKIKCIGFDADDTLWINEPLFQEAGKKFENIIHKYISNINLEKELYKTESSNIKIFGYGVKGFTLSMIETAVELTGGKINSKDILEIVNLGKGILTSELQLLNDVEFVLKKLSRSYKLIVATKGDLLDQENKLEASGLSKYFHHIEVMSEKNADSYIKLLGHLDIAPENFLMIGNSLKSDILPVIEIGSRAIHVPFSTTWEHEKVDPAEIKNVSYQTVDKIKEILNYF